MFSRDERGQVLTCILSVVTRDNLLCFSIKLIGTGNLINHFQVPGFFRTVSQWTPWKLVKMKKDERPHNIFVSYVKNGKELRCLELKVAYCIKYLFRACATGNLQVSFKYCILTLPPVAIENVRSKLWWNVTILLTTSWSLAWRLLKPRGLNAVHPQISLRRKRENESLHSHGGWKS